MRYTIKSGDTLGRIASKYDISLDELMRGDGLTNVAEAVGTANGV